MIVMFGAVLCSCSKNSWCVFTVHHRICPMWLFDCPRIIVIVLLFFTLYRRGPLALGAQRATIPVAEQAFRPRHVSLGRAPNPFLSRATVL